MISKEIIDSLTDYASVKDKINCRLINAEHNAEYLSDKPHTMMDDLAVTYHVDLGETEQGHATTPVTNILMKQYGIDTDELHDVAIRNMDVLSPMSFKTMSETMAELMLPDMLSGGMSREEATDMVKGMFPPELDRGMYVLTNQSKHHGAAVILNPKTMDEITEKVGKEYYILPSSIHEVLIVPKRDGMELKDLEGMVRDVNGTQVAPHERLSDHVFAYDIKAHELFRADKSTERAQEKKPSISDALKTPLPDKGSRASKVPVKGDGAR
ncbi:MAG: hypothetical protein IJQ26_02115 [Lachnospiraceae bacterium]|nr:hypothetical protein [Lachnospiraceae bacterium]